MQESPIQDFGFALIYASDSKRAVAFYQKYFAFNADESKKMDGDQVFGYIGPIGIWIGGGHTKITHAENDTRATVMLRVKSSTQLFNRFKDDGIKLFQKEPIKMSAKSFWFQCADPDGNILDFLGEE